MRVFIRGRSSEQSAMMGTQAALPSCSRRVLQTALSLLSEASASQGRRSRLNANSQCTVAQVHQVFLNFANRSSLFMSHGFKTMRFSQRKNLPKNSRRGTGSTGAGSGCFSARWTPARSALPHAPRSLLWESLSSPPGGFQVPHPAPARRINTVDITIIIFI